MKLSLDTAPVAYSTAKAEAMVSELNATGDDWIYSVVINVLPDGVTPNGLARIAIHDEDGEFVGFANF